jgi:hypothetical protein
VDKSVNNDILRHPHVTNQTAFSAISLPQIESVLTAYFRQLGADRVSLTPFRTKDDMTQNATRYYVELPLSPLYSVSLKLSRISPHSPPAAATKRNLRSHITNPIR